MAARSSSSEQEPLVLRITYDELVALADELDEKKKKKHSKKSSGEKCEKGGERQENEELENDADRGSDNTRKRDRKSSAKKKRDSGEKKEQKEDGKKQKKSLSRPKEEQKLVSVSSDSKVAKESVNAQTNKPEEHGLELRAHTGDNFEENKDYRSKHDGKSARPTDEEKDVLRGNDEQKNAQSTPARLGEHDLELKPHGSHKLKEKKDDGSKHKKKTSRSKEVQKDVSRGIDKQNLVHEHTHSTADEHDLELKTPGTGANQKEKIEGGNKHKKKTSRSKEVLKDVSRGIDKQNLVHENTHSTTTDEHNLELKTLGVGTNQKEKMEGGNKHKKKSARSKEVTDKQTHVHKNAHSTGPDENNLEVRASRGGVLKLPKGKKVSFKDSDSEVNYEQEVPSPNTDSKCRGIIRIPEGLDLRNSISDAQKQESDGGTGIDLGYKCSQHSEGQKVSQEKGANYSRLYDPDRPERKLGTRARRWSENEISSVHTEDGHLKSSHSSQVHKRRTSLETSVPPHQTHAEDVRSLNNMTLDTSDVSCSGKTERQLNKEKTQQLMNLATHAQTSLSNLLSRDVLDKREFQKVRHLSREIQNHYRSILMLDVGFAAQHDVDQLLWRSAFYQVIETFRKYGKLFLGYSEKKGLLSQEEINKELLEFLEESRSFYGGLLESFQSKHHFIIQDLLEQPRRAEELVKNAKLAVISCHHSLIFLGDIERYKDEFHSVKNWGVVRTWYLNACKLVPKNGKPYNQLAVVAVYANRKLDAVYYYIRSLAVSNPILTAKEKLTTIFHEIQKKAFELQKREDEEQLRRSRMEEARERKKGRERFPHEGNKGTAKEDPSQSKHEVWVFMRRGAVRKLVLSEQGLVQEVNQAGQPVTEEDKKPAESTENVQSPKVSLQEVNKKFLLHFLCAHGMLYTRIGMERLPALHYQLMGEFQTLLGFPLCATYVSCTNLLELMAINMFAICHTASRDCKDEYVRVGTPQDQALNLAVDMLISLLNSCTSLLQKLDNDKENHETPEQVGNHGHHGFSAPLRQFLPAVKVWADWLICHVVLWQASSISTHRKLWDSVAHFINASCQIELPDLAESNDDGELVTLTEDEFLAGFKLLSDANRPLCKVPNSVHKDLAKDHLHMQAVKDLAIFLSSVENPPLQYNSDTGQFCTLIQSTPTSPAVESAAVAVDLDTTQEEDHEESDLDDVIIESVEEEQDSGDDMAKDVKELKAKRDALTRRVEANKEREDKIKAVIAQQASKPKLMLENYPSYLVSDTNCFIDHLNELHAIVASGDFTLVVPLVVINELDGLKKDAQVNKYHDMRQAQLVMENARSAIGFLEDQFSTRNPQVKALTSKGSVLDTIAFRSEDPSGRKGNNDDVILSCCLHYCEENFVNRLATADQPITIRRKVVLLTDDRNLRLKAYTRNVPVLTVPQFLKMAQL